LPLVLWRDANFADLETTYPWYKERHRLSKKWAHAQEKRAMRRAILNLFAAECSYHTATSTYQIAAESIAVVPLGAIET
jgi:hypothetical protein